MNENSKKLVKLMEFYQIPKSAQDMITDMTSTTSKATVMVTEEILIPIRYSKPSLVAEPGVCPGVGAMAPPSISGATLAAAVHSFSLARLKITVQMLLIQRFWCETRKIYNDKIITESTRFYFK